MTRNIGRNARLIRTLFGVSVLMIGAAMQSWWALVGLIPIVIAIVGYCPLRGGLASNTGGDPAGTTRARAGSCCSDC